MQQEDDLRGLARVMDFMRAVSILFVGINVYWFCYSTLKEWGVTFEVIDKILWNFQRTTGLFSSVLWTKLFAVVFLALSADARQGEEHHRKKFCPKDGREQPGGALEIPQYLVYHFKGYSPFFQGGVTEPVHVYSHE